MIIPHNWKAVLKRLQENGFPEAVIAGGAIRDLDNDKPVKDVDIFIRKPADLEGKSLEGLVEEAMERQADEVAIDFQVGENVLDDDETYALHEMSIFAIYRFFIEGDKFEVIVMHFPEEVPFLGTLMDDFDIAFCQGMYSEPFVLPTTGILDCPLFSELYDADKFNKTITILKAPTTAAYARTLKRALRIQQKYPDFTIRFAEGVRDPYDVTDEEVANV